ncbi:ABC transporter ATP-binding protein [uncultured Maritimibacter sp.]|jgi:capsular polysaccharide transport system ATP-binding protein|uniref:ABC transporter ATP-binding protein n=1 Tax=uncultured Maritimibacter sp. TaxID=991866 RepID=UPI000B0DDE6B|nr:ABC transporter ATP-binding protein [uncultured Maritimibacter sp.]
MIAFDTVTKVYTVKNVRKVILDKASFLFESNRNIAIMGHNGAGKSTIMRMLSGIELPTSGVISRDEKVSWPMGFAKGFNGNMTGIENVRFVSRIYGEDPNRVLESVQEFAELGKSIDLPVTTYSSGMKARLAFGLSLAIDFESYLIDEITAVGDRRFKKKSNDALRAKIENARVIMISHSESTIREYCDSGVLVHGSKLYYYDDLEGLLADYNRFA